MSRRSIRLRHLIVMLVAVALVAAACGDDDDATDDPIEDAIGVIEVGAGGQIQIRAHQAISGPVAFLGDDQVRGIELAIADFGDIHGFSVNLGTPEDDLCRAEGGQSGAQAIVAQDNIVAVIGTTCSGAARAAAPIYTGAGMVIFSGSNTAPDLTSDLLGTAGENYHVGFFRTAHNDLIQGAAVAKFVYEELGLTRAAAIHDGDPYTQGLANAFRVPFENLGGEVPVFTAVDPDGTDMTAVLTEVAAANVEAVFFPIFQPAGDFIITQKDGIAGLGDVVWLGADGLFISDYLSIPETEGMYFSGPDLDFGANQAVTGVSYTDLVTRYEAEYGERPLAAFHAHTYDATLMVLTAIREVSVLGSDGTLRIPQQALRDSLFGMRNFAGVTGSLSCDQYGDCAAANIQIAFHDDSSVTDLDAKPVPARYTAAELMPLLGG
jgi:branched-chain amino acid transport system substrate-binding protein